MRTTRTNLGLLLGLIALVLFGVIAGGLSGGETDFAERLNQRELVGNGAFAAVFAAMIGVMAMTSEFRHGTIRATFVFTPARMRVVSAKVIASLGVGAAFGLLGAALALGGTIILSALWAGLGVGLGAIVRNQVLAIVGLFVWVFVIEILVFQFLPGIGRYAPGAAGTAMTGDTVGDSSVHLLSGPAGSALLAGYAAAFVLAGALVTTRRDVT
jgi:ABC-2 type transport system permease protein